MAPCLPRSCFVVLEGYHERRADKEQQRGAAEAHEYGAEKSVLGSRLQELPAPDGRWLTHRSRNRREHLRELPRLEVAVLSVYIYRSHSFEMDISFFALQLAQDP